MFWFWKKYTTMYILKKLIYKTFLPFYIYIVYKHAPRVEFLKSTRQRRVLFYKQHDTQWSVVLYLETERSEVSKLKRHKWKCLYAIYTAVLLDWSFKFNIYYIKLLIYHN